MARWRQVEETRRGFWNDLGCSRSDRDAVVCQASEGEGEEEEGEEGEGAIANLDRVNRFKVRRWKKTVFQSRRTLSLSCSVRFRSEL